MSKKFIVFAGVIFIIVFGVMQIAVISILGVNANINLDRTIAIFSGFFSLFGGIIGATGAYFIAKEQIKKQDSMRKMDWKLEKFEYIIVCLNDMIKELEDFSEKILEAALIWEEYDEQEIEEHVVKVKSSFYEIKKLSIYFKFIDIEPEVIMINLENSVMLTITKNPENTFTINTYDHAFKSVSYLQTLKNNLEKEIESIISD